MDGELKLLNDDGINGSGLDLPFFKYYAISVGFFFVTILSATLLYPISHYYMTKTRIDNTRIDGRKLVFDGKISTAFYIYYTGLVATAVAVAALNLIIEVLPLELKTYALNYALSGVTAAIAAFFIGTRLRRWEKKNTHYVGAAKGQSGMKGNLVKCAVKSAVSSLLGLVTVGIAYPLVFKVKQKYYVEASRVDGEKLSLDGNVVSVYGKWFLGILLTVITLGVALPLPLYYLAKWEAENTHKASENG